jgi:hypothetical protein
MTEHDHEHDDLRARLRAADPAASLGPADPDGVARLLEDTMSHDTDTLVPERRTGTHGRNPLTWLVAAAAVLVIAGAGVWAVTSDPDEGSTPPIAESSDEPGEPGELDDQVVITQLRAPAETAGRCMVPTAEILANQQLAFAGTVEEITDGTVVLVPTTFYAGEEADRVEVAAPAQEMTALIGAVDFQVGQSYLVSATGGQVSACGFSGPQTPELEQLYVDAFGG